MKTLSALIPFFNEERTIPELVRQISKLPDGTLEHCVFVNDGSTDRSLECLKSALTKTNLSYSIINKVNGGKASAIMEGSKALFTTHVVILDSDLELATADIAKLWAIVLKNESEFVFGYRKLLGDIAEEISLFPTCTDFFSMKLLPTSCAVIS
jgi:dolichol-phosphate mannosyltransferase